MIDCSQASPGSSPRSDRHSQHVSAIGAAADALDEPLPPALLRAARPSPQQSPCDSPLATTRAFAPMIGKLHAPAAAYAGPPRSMSVKGSGIAHVATAAASRVGGASASGASTLCAASLSALCDADSMATSLSSQSVPSPSPPVSNVAAHEPLPTMVHEGAFWEVRHGALRLQLSWRSYSATAHATASRHRCRRALSAGAGVLSPPSSGLVPPRDADSGVAAVREEETPDEGSEKRGRGGGSDDSASTQSRGSAKSWIVMEKVLAQLPNMGRPQAATTAQQVERDTEVLGVDAASKGAAGSKGIADPPCPEVSFTEDLYSQGRVVGTVTGVLRMRDLPEVEQLHHGTLTESGIAFTGPIVIGEGGHAPNSGGINGNAGSSEGGALAGSDGAARLGSLLVRVSHALRRGDESTRQASAVELAKLLRSSHKETLVCFLFRDLHALYACRNLMLDLWEEVWPSPPLSPALPCSPLLAPARPPSSPPRSRCVACPCHLCCLWDALLLFCSTDQSTLVGRTRAIAVVVRPRVAVTRLCCTCRLLLAHSAAARACRNRLHLARRGFGRCRQHTACARHALACASAANARVGLAVCRRAACRWRWARAA